MLQIILRMIINGYNLINHLADSREIEKHNPKSHCYIACL